MVSVKISKSTDTAICCGMYGYSYLVISVWLVSYSYSCIVIEANVKTHRYNRLPWHALC